MPQPNATVAVDGELTARHRTCLLCGRRPDVLEVQWRVVGGLVVSSATCLHCRKDEAVVRAVLEARYGTVA
jgi:hypothetical protein